MRKRHYNWLARFADALDFQFPFDVPKSPDSPTLAAPAAAAADRERDPCGGRRKKEGWMERHGMAARLCSTRDVPFSREVNIGRPLILNLPYQLTN